MSQPIIERPELLAHEYWTIAAADRPSLTIAYIDVDGQSPNIINHLSSVTYSIIEGCGRIATDSRTDFNIPAGGTEEVVSVSARKGQPHSFSGRFSAFIEYPFPPYARFVTYDGQTLDRQDKKVLRQAFRQPFWERLMDEVMARTGVIEELVLHTYLLQTGVPKTLEQSEDSRLN